MTTRAILPASLLALGVAVSPVRADVVGDYKIILERNPFGLKPPPEPPAPQTNAPPETPTKFKLSGITGIFRPARAMFVDEGVPNKVQFFSLSEGQTQGSLKVLPGGIDIKAGTVRVEIAGVERTMSFEKDGLKATSAPGLATAPGVPRPMPMPGFNPVPATPGGTTSLPAANAGPPNTLSYPQAIPAPAATSAVMPPPAQIQSPVIPGRQIRGSGTTSIPLTYQNQTTPPTPAPVDPAEQALKMEINEKLNQTTQSGFPPLPPTDLRSR